MMLEPVLPYDGVATPAAAAAEAQIDPRLLTAVVAAVFGVTGEQAATVQLRRHQVDALRTHFSRAPCHHPVVTSGTGSGKTEAFLVPLLTRIAQEAQKDAGTPAVHPWWDIAEQTLRWEPARRHTLRTPAMRAMILYPTNALVEDQLVRLRRAVRRLREEPGPLDLWFGRYTGATPGSGAKPGIIASSSSATETAHALREMTRTADRLIDLNRVDLAEQFPDPRFGELITRWDMTATPPDVLVTNYSMLNAMLMRGLEDPVFDTTRAWLSQSRTNAFTLVVDELHLYRGSAGAEVGMVVRNLVSRLGLTPDSEQPASSPPVHPCRATPQEPAWSPSSEPVVRRSPCTPASHVPPHRSPR